MLFSLSFTTIILIFTGFSAAYNLIRWIIDPLRHIPGPFLARFTRLWYLYKIHHGDFEKTNVELHQKFGPIVRIAPNEYSIDDVAAAKVIYGHGNSFAKVCKAPSLGGV